MGQPPLLEMDSIRKTFHGGVVANDDVSLSVSEGEIHGILGENGAGKSTLMNIIYGLYQQDSGEVRIRGETVDITSPEDAIEHGIGMVHQHFMLIPRLTVVQNLVLGTREPSARFDSLRRSDADGGVFRSLLGGLAERFSIDLSRPRRRIEELSEAYGFDVDPDDRIRDLDIGQQQRVEILRALFRDVDLLVLDEPTAVLTPHEADRLFEMLEQLVADGMTVIFITHKLDEVLAVTDRVTILRDGSVVDTVETDTVNENQLAEMMVGRDVVLDVDKDERSLEESIVLEGTDLLATDERGQVALDSVSIQLNRGEILGVAGVSGNGQRELGECLAGVRDVDDGRIALDGEDITDMATREVIDSGISLIPEDRLEHGVVPDLDLVSNAILKTYWTEPVMKPGLIDEIDYDAARDHAAEIVDRYDVDAPSLDTPIKFLSGGNIQRFVVGREVERDPDVLVANQPTRGVDVGAIEYIREILIDESDDGTAILLISESLDEVLSLSDRVLVMNQGEVVHETTPADTTSEEIGLYMTGGESAVDTTSESTDGVVQTDG